MSNLDEFKLGSFSTVGGGDFVPESVRSLAAKTVGEYPVLAGAALLVLAIMVIWMWWGKESFNPTQTLRSQDGDQFGLGNREFLDNPAPAGTPAASVFSQTAQAATQGTFTVDPKAAVNQPGSLGYQVLNSADFDCANRKSIGDNAWDWMNGVAHESAVGKPSNDNDFSRILAGK